MHSISVVNIASRIDHHCMSAVSGLGQFVRERRASLGKTGKDFADAIGIDPGTLSRLETGVAKTFPEPWLIRALARELNVSPVSLLMAAGYLDREAPEPASEIVSMLIDRIREPMIHDDTARTILGTIEHMERAFRERQSSINAMESRE